MTSNGRDGLSTEKLSPRVRELGVCAFIAALVGGVFALDCLTPRGISVWVLYILPLVLTSRTSHPWSSPVVAAICTVLTLFGYILSPEVPGVPIWLSQVSRSFCLAIFPLIAYLGYREKRLTDRKSVV